MIFFFEYALLLDMHDDILSGFIGVVKKTQFLFDVITHKIRSEKSGTKASFWNNKKHTQQIAGK